MGRQLDSSERRRERPIEDRLDRVERCAGKDTQFFTELRKWREDRLKSGQETGLSDHFGRGPALNAKSLSQRMEIAKSGDQKLMSDKEQNEKHAADEMFGPNDNSYLAKVFRGEIKPEYDKSVPAREEYIFWETASIQKEDGRIVNCVCGQYKREYFPDHPDYNVVLQSLKARFPELEPGKLCSLYRYRDGRAETKTKDY